MWIGPTEQDREEAEEWKRYVREPLSEEEEEFLEALERASFVPKKPKSPFCKCGGGISLGTEDDPSIKCTRCGQKYRW